MIRFAAAVAASLFIVLPADGSWAGPPLHLERLPEPVLEPGERASWESINVEPSTVIVEDGLFRMWYTGYDGRNHRIGYAESEDGIEWTRAPEPVVDTGGEEGAWDTVSVAQPSVVYDGEKYRMWYTVGNGDRTAIGYAESEDGLAWTKYAAPVLLPETKEPWAWVEVMDPSVILENGRFRMWYVGFNGVDYGVGYAESEDGIVWERSEDNPVFGPSGDMEGSWDFSLVLFPQVVKEPDGGYTMWYAGKGESRLFAVGRAVSSDGIEWKRAAAPELEPLEVPGNWEEAGVLTPVFARRGQTAYLWYGGHDGRRTRTGLAVDDGRGWKRLASNPVMDVDDGYAWDDAAIYRGTVLPVEGGYRMWFTGFTGARASIGTAFSPDGVNWTKLRRPVIEPGAPGSWDRMRAAYPSVIFEDGRFRMWYSGHDGYVMRIGCAESTDGVEWSKCPQNPVFDLAEGGGPDQAAYPAVVRIDDGYAMYYTRFDGLRQTLGMALSDDGYAWTPVSGEIVDAGAVGGELAYPWVLAMEDGTYRLWCTAVTDGGYFFVTASSDDGLSWGEADEVVLPIEKEGLIAKAPMVLVDDDGLYHMWYERYGGETTWLSYAVSRDGYRWTPYEERAVVDTGPRDGWDSFGVAGGSVLRDGDRYMLWYSGHDGVTFRIGLATSTDGVHWTRHPENPVLDLGPRGSWDDARVDYPLVIKEDGLYRMFYGGSGNVPWAPPSIGVATSTDGVHWTRLAESPVLGPGEAGGFDDTYIGYPMVMKEGDRYRLWYAGSDRYGQWKIGYAESTDGIEWSRLLGPVLDLGEEGSWDSMSVSYPRVVKFAGRYLLFYGGTDGGALRIGLATSEDGIFWERSAGTAILEPGEKGSWDGASVLGPMPLVEDGRIRLWFTAFDEERLFRLGLAETPAGDE
ncbi:MAG TPA: hypothetical protein ENJ37_10190 [Deltaproteobacteria bacterium]|nr:hypothetical protein [Deltaproteobacteria bacterium]